MRCWCLVITSLDAEMFTITCAPEGARNDDGGIGVQKSSQISIPNVALPTVNSRLGEMLHLWPQYLMIEPKPSR